MKQSSAIAGFMGQRMKFEEILIELRHIFWKITPVSKQNRIKITIELDKETLFRFESLVLKEICNKLPNWDVTGLNTRKMVCLGMEIELKEYNE